MMSRKNGTQNEILASAGARTGSRASAMGTGCRDSIVRTGRQVSTACASRRIPTARIGHGISAMRNDPRTSSLGSGNRASTREAGCRDSIVRAGRRVSTARANRRIPTARTGHGISAMRNDPRTSILGSGSRVSTRETGCRDSILEVGRRPSAGMLCRVHRRVSMGLLCLLVMVASVTLSFAASGAGTVIYTNTDDLGGGFAYNTTISLEDGGLRQESHSAITTPGAAVRPVVLACDTIYGTLNLDRVLRYAAELGYQVLGGINSDFFMPSTGVPLGIAVEGGVLRSSPEGYPAVVFDGEGRAEILDHAEIAMTMDVNGHTVTVDHFNKQRYDQGGVYLLDEHFSTVSTRTNSEGWMVRLRILEGQPTVSGTMRLEVDQVFRTKEAQRIDPGYLFLTAADLSYRYEDYGWFRKGDIVTFRTECQDAALAGCQWASGGGDVLIRDGAVTDSRYWDSALKGRNPRSAVGIREDGSVLYYTVDGRSPGYSSGLTMNQLAEELQQAGCVQAINLDGGGSTILELKLPGEEQPVVVNQPSDGSPRKCATFILFTASEPSDGVPVWINMDYEGMVVLCGSTVNLSYRAVDRGFSTVDAPADVVASSEDGTVHGNAFTAGPATGTQTIALRSEASGLEGNGHFYAVDTLSSVDFYANGEQTDTLTLQTGDTVQFTQYASYYGMYAFTSPDAFTYEVSPGLGTVTENGILTVAPYAPASGWVTVSGGGWSKTVQVQVTSPLNDIYGHWAMRYIVNLHQNGIVVGNPDGSYGPQNRIRRGDFMLMLYRAAGETAASVETEPAMRIPEYREGLTYVQKQVSAGSMAGMRNTEYGKDRTGTKTSAGSKSDMAGNPETILQVGGISATAAGVVWRSPEARIRDSAAVTVFDDVSPEAYYAEAVAWAASQGIALGDGKSFFPQSDMTREQAFTFLYRWLNRDGQNVAGTDPAVLGAFADAGDISGYAVEPVCALVEQGIVNGSGGRIWPKESLTRAEMAKILDLGIGMEDPGE